MTMSLSIVNLHYINLLNAPVHGITIRSLQIDIHNLQIVTVLDHRVPDLPRSVELDYHYPNNGHVSVNIWICNTSTFKTLVKASRLSLITTFLRLSINNLDEQDTISGRTEYLL